MKKKIILFFGVIFLLVISGCKGGSSSGKSFTDEDIRKGIEGLTIELTKNAPPASVFEDTVFPIGITLRNKGASNIGAGEGFLSISLEKTFLDFVEKNDEPLQFEIEGKSIFNLNGDERFERVDVKTKDIGAQSETRTTTIFATACYQYKTKLGTSVCIDTDIFERGIREKACQVKDLEFNAGQGGPVAITKIETRILPDADPDSDKVIPHFIIHVENKGNGEVIVPEQEKIRNACTSESLSHKDFNRIIITAKLSNELLDCSVKEEESEAEIRLREKKAVARCTLENGIERNQDAYTSPLSITLDYGYTFTISKDIIIEKILRY